MFGTHKFIGQHPAVVPREDSICTNVIPRTLWEDGDVPVRTYPRSIAEFAKKVTYLATLEA